MFFQMLLKVYVWLLQRAYGLNFHKTGEIDVMYIVKNDNPDVGFSVSVGEVTDAEGEVIDNAELQISVSSSDEEVISITDNGDGTGQVHFGHSGTASVQVEVKGPNGQVLGSGGDVFTVTTGDPSAISAVGIGFDGLTPVEEPPVE